MRKPIALLAALAILLLSGCGAPAPAPTPESTVQPETEIALPAPTPEPTVEAFYVRYPADTEENGISLMTDGTFTERLSAEKIYNGTYIKAGDKLRLTYLRADGKPDYDLAYTAEGDYIYPDDINFVLFYGVWQEPTDDEYNGLVLKYVDYRDESEAYYVFENGVCTISTEQGEEQHEYSVERGCILSVPGIGYNFLNTEDGHYYRVFYENILADVK